MNRHAIRRPTPEAVRTPYVGHEPVGGQRLRGRLTPRSTGRHGIGLMVRLQGKFNGPVSRLRSRLQSSGATPIALASFIAFTVVFLRWFTTGRFYATGDITPWVRTGLASDLGWQWTHQLTGAGGPSYEIARAPEVLFNNVGRLLGGGEALGQRLLFSTMWAFAAAGGAALVGAFARRRVTVVIGGLATAFNAWFLLYLPNFLPVLTVGILGSTTAIAVRAARGERRRPILFAAVLLPLSYVSINPPLVLVVSAWSLILPVVAASLTGSGRAGIVRVLRLLLVAALFVVPLSLWWVVPMFIALSRSVGTASVGAVTDVVAWSWTHRRNSIPNVFTLHSEWSWPMRQYHGASVDLAKPAFAWLDWILPSGVVLAPLLVGRSRRRPFLVVGALLPVMVILGKGLHAPFSDFSLRLYRTVPGLWLLREPMSKLGAIFVMIYVLAWAVSIESILDRVAGFRTLARARAAGTKGTKASNGATETLPTAHRRVRVAWATLLSIMLLGPVVSVYPMWTGAATADVQPGRSERVAIPTEWRTVAAHINDSKLRGKALVLPLGDFYQMPTTWGFYGTDNLVRQLLDRPVISRNPEGYITDSPTFDLLARAVETAIAAGEAEKSVSLLRALGVSHVVVRKDFDLATPQRIVTNVRDFRPIASGLTRVRELRTSIDTGVARVFEFTDRRSEPVQLLSGVLSTGAVPDDALVPLLTSIPADQALADDGHAVTIGAAWSSNVGVSVQEFSTPKGGTFLVDRRTRSVPAYIVSARPASQGAPAALTLNEVSRFRLGNADLAARPTINVPLANANPVGMDVNGDLIDLRRGGAYLTLDSATRVNVLSESDGRLGTFGKVADCNAQGFKAIPELSSSITLTPSGAVSTVELQAAAHSACVSATVSGAKANDVVMVHVQHRSLAGRAARVCLLAIGPNRCLPVPEPTFSQGWGTVDGLVRLPPGTTSARLYLYADGPDKVRVGAPKTVTQYREIGVTRLAVAASTVLTASPPATGTLTLPPGEHQLLTSVDLPTPTLDSWGPVEDCNRHDDRSKSDVGLSSARPAGSEIDPTDDTAVVLRANAHSACVSAAIHGMKNRATYELSLTYRSLVGTTRPRVCLLDPATSKCIAVRALRGTTDRPLPNRGWTTVRYAVAAAIDTTKGAKNPRLYVYADTALGRTELSYTNVAMTPMADESVTIIAAATKPAPLPNYTWTQRNSARYDVSVQNATHPFVLALSDSWSPDWQVAGLPHDAKVTQMRIDGYRNGWLIDAKGDLRLRVQYVPARWGRLALQISITAAFVTLIIAFAATHRHRRRAGTQSQG